jgi:vitamin B12 transporter
VRVIRLAVFWLLFSSFAFASDVTIKVVDPQAKVVPGARVVLVRSGESASFQVQSTTSEGEAVFSGVKPGGYQVRVLAPGFAFSEGDITVPGTMTVQLKIAAPNENVQVTATRTPLPSDESGASIATLNAGQLTSMQPVDEAEALRFLPGAVTSNAGQRGGLSSLFVRGGDSRYNKVIIDDVTVNDPGGTFDFGVVPMNEINRLEMVRGAVSDLYGSDAMTSVIQTWSRTGTSLTPELMFGADGGNFDTAHGYVAVSGARGRFDYNLFGDQFNTIGQGPNDDYSNSSQGGNVGVRITPRIQFRLRLRHSNNRSGIQSFWKFNGLELVPPDLDQRARQNNFLSSAQISIGGSRSQHRFTGFEYHHTRFNIDDVMEAGRLTPAFGGFNFDSPFSELATINRAGFEYQGEYWERSWARTTFGYRFEDENGFVGDITQPPPSHGLRLNHDLYGEQVLTLGRAVLIGGLRYVHNGSFGDKVVPRIAGSYLLLRGGSAFSGTRLHGSYATGIKEPRLEETFATGPFTIPNPNLKEEENRAFDAGVEQKLAQGKYVLSATYFHNLFRNQIEFNSDPLTFIGQYVNVNRSLSHGMEAEFHARISSRLSLDSGYTYTSTQILAAPLCTPDEFCDPLLAAGQPLLRRAKHFGSLLLNYFGNRWGGSIGGTFVGRRPDSDFLGLVPHVDHASGYGRVDFGGWYAIHPRVTAYINVENALDRQYEEAAGYPGLGVNFRAGLRFKVGGD